MCFDTYFWRDRWTCCIWCQLNYTSIENAINSASSASLHFTAIYLCERAGACANDTAFDAMPGPSLNTSGFERNDSQLEIFASLFLHMMDSKYSTDVIAAARSLQVFTVCFPLGNANSLWWKSITFSTFMVCAASFDSDCPLLTQII